MRSPLLRALLAVGVLALPLAGPPGAWACAYPVGWPSPGGYAHVYYYLAPVYYYTPGSTEARAYKSVPAPPPLYGSYSYPRYPATSSSDGGDSRIFERWKPDPADPFSHSGQ
jgi:hypothetical protein